MRTSWSRPVILIVPAALVFLLAACTNATSAGAPPESSTNVSAASFARVPCWKPNFPGVPQLDLSSDFTCGYLRVPENRSHPNGRQIQVAVAIVPAVSKHPKPDPLLYLTGGPGGTGIVTAMQRVAAGINADREVIFIDQRGTFHSQPSLTCPEVDAFNNLLPTLNFFDPATLRRSTAATTACRTRWEAQGYDLAGYNTAENASDIADLRVALGIRAWNLYGVSYGSELAQTVLRDHPRGIRSVVLDSVVPVASNLYQAFWDWPPAGYTALFDACAAQVSCARAFPRLRAEFEGAVRRLTAHPLTVAVKTPAGRTEKVIVDGFMLANVAVTASLAPGFIDKLPAAIHRIAHGDGAAVAAMAAAPAPSGVVGYGLGFGVLCAENVAWTTPAKALSAARRANPSFPDRVLTPRVTQAPDLLSDCGIWDVPKSAPNTHDRVISSVPTLLMSGGLDAVTPKANAADVAAGLSRAQSVTIPGAGHDVLLWDGKCSQVLMNKFLDDPVARIDRSCVSTLTNPIFSTTAGR